MKEERERERKNGGRGIDVGERERKKGGRGRDVGKRY